MIAVARGHVAKRPVGRKLLTARQEGIILEHRRHVAVCRPDVVVCHGSGAARIVGRALRRRIQTGIAVVVIEVETVSAGRHDERYADIVGCIPVAVPAAGLTVVHHQRSAVVVDAAPVVAAAIESGVVHALERYHTGRRAVVKAVFLTEHHTSRFIREADAAVGLGHRHRSGFRAQHKGGAVFRHREFAHGRSRHAYRAALGSVVAGRTGEHLHHIVIVRRQSQRAIGCGDDHRTTVAAPSAVFAQSDAGLGDYRDCGCAQVDSHRIISGSIHSPLAVIGSVLRHTAVVRRVAEEELLLVIVAVAVCGYLERAGHKLRFARELERIRLILRQRECLPQIPAAGSSRTDQIEYVMVYRFLLIGGLDHRHGHRTEVAGHVIVGALLHLEFIVGNASGPGIRQTRYIIGILRSIAVLFLVPGGLCEKLEFLVSLEPSRIAEYVAAVAVGNHHRSAVETPAAPGSVADHQQFVGSLKGSHGKPRGCHHSRYPFKTNVIFHDR